MSSFCELQESCSQSDSQLPVEEHSFCSSHCFHSLLCREWDDFFSVDHFRNVHFHDDKAALFVGILMKDNWELNSDHKDEEVDELKKSGKFSINIKFEKISS